MNDSVALRTFQHRSAQRLPVWILVIYGCQDIDQHRMYDETVVIIPVKLRSIAIDPVSEVPLHMLAERIVDTHPIQKSLLVPETPQ